MTLAKIKILATLLCIVAAMGIMAQQAPITKEKLAGIWVIETGTFPDERIVFKAYDAARDSSRIYGSYSFVEGGDIKYSTHVPRGIGICGNGLMFLSDSKWDVTNNELEVYLKGGFFADGTYEYRLVYEIESLTDKRLVLKKKKTITQKRCETCYE